MNPSPFQRPKDEFSVNGVPVEPKATEPKIEIDTSNKLSKTEELLLKLKMLEEAQKAGYTTLYDRRIRKWEEVEIEKPKPKTQPKKQSFFWSVVKGFWFGWVWYMLLKLLGIIN